MYDARLPFFHLQKECSLLFVHHTRASGTGVLASSTGSDAPNSLWELTGRFRAVLGILLAVKKYRYYRLWKRAVCHPISKLKSQF